MTAPTVQVRVELFTQDGAAAEGIVVRALLDKNDEFSGGQIIAVPTTATTDADGVAFLTLFPNHPTTGLGTTGSGYTITATVGLGSFRADNIQVPNADCDLDDLTDAPLGSAPTAVTTHISNPTGAHAASAISVAGMAQGTNAQAVLEALAETTAPDLSGYATTGDLAGKETAGAAAALAATLGSASTHPATDFATAAQGVKADAAIPSGGLKTLNGASLEGAGNIAIVSSPSGADTQVQFNDGGAFGGDAGLTYNKTTDTLTAGAAVITGALSAGELNAGSGNIRNAGIYGTANEGWRLYSAGQYGWTATSASAAVDTALARNAAGVVEINNGTAGTYRDLKARSVLTENGTYSALSVAIGTDGSGFFRNAYGSVALVINGADALSYVFNYAYQAVADSWMLKWTNASGATYGTVDTGIKRNAAGVVEINNGTAGTYRDLALRGLKFAANLTVATLPSAAASEGFIYRVSDSNAPAVGATVASGGAAKCSVQSDGAAWKVIWIA